jgi:TolA-binding protein
MKNMILKNIGNTAFLLAALLIYNGYAFSQDEGTAKNGYAEAKSLYESDQYDEAYLKFSDFLKKYANDKKSDDAAYFKARCMYQQKNYSESVIEFSQFLLDYGSLETKVYNHSAQYYLAKSHYNSKNYEQSLKEFKKLITDYPDSKRVSSAQYDAGKSYYQLDNFDNALTSFQNVIDLYPDTSDASSAQYYIGKSYYQLEKYDDALASFQEVLDTYPDSSDASSAQYYIGKSYYQKKMYDQSLKTFEAVIRDYPDSSIRSFAENYIQKIEKKKVTDLTMKVEVLGGGNNLPKTPASYIDGNFTVNFPLSYDQSIKLGVSGYHKDQSFKTFNFPATEINDEVLRLFQTVNKISGKATWIAGVDNPLYSRLSVAGDYLFAEDQGDSFWNVEMKENLSLDLNSVVSLGFLAAGNLKIFPNYLSSGRKLDSYSLEAAPEIKWSINRDFNVTLGYDFIYKQYLDAKYSDDAGDSTYITSLKDKYYFEHNIDINLGVNYFKKITPKIGYRFTLNQSKNYGSVITGLDDTGSQEIRFIENYFDYYLHTFTLSTNFQLNDAIGIDVSADFGSRYFLNYPARDSGNTFIGEFRNDSSIELDLGFDYFFLQYKDFEFHMYLKAQYNKNVSNMEYQNSFQTNYKYVEGYSGLLIKIP